MIMHIIIFCSTTVLGSFFFRVVFSAPTQKKNWLTDYSDDPKWLQQAKTDFANDKLSQLEFEQLLDKGFAGELEPAQTTAAMIAQAPFAGVDPWTTGTKLHHERAIKAASLRNKPIAHFNRTEMCHCGLCAGGAGWVIEGHHGLSVSEARYALDFKTVKDHYTPKLLLTQQELVESLW